MIVINNQNIHVAHIIDILPDKMSIIIKRNDDYEKLPNIIRKLKFAILLRVPNIKLLNEIKFEYVKYVKTSTDPYQRVADFEYRDENGLPDFKKMDKLVFARLTKKEKQAEIDRLVELIKFLDSKNENTEIFKNKLMELL